MIHKKRSWANKFIICFPVLFFFFCPSGKTSSQKEEKREKKCRCVHYYAVKSFLVMEVMQKNEERRTVNCIKIPHWLIKNR